MPGDATATAAPSELGRRITVTAAVVALLLLGERVPLPLIDRDQLHSLIRSAPIKPISLLAIGLMPFFVAFLLVECVAAALPRLRRLRHGSAAERAPLTRVAWALALVLATIVSWNLARELQDLRDPNGYPLLAYGLGIALGATGVFVLGTIAAGSGAVLISRRGLGNGFAVLFATEAAETVLRFGRSLFQQPAGSWSDVTLLIGLSLLVAIPLVLTHQRRRESTGPRVPIPTCGLVVVQIVSAFFFFPTVLAKWFPSLSPLAKALRTGPYVYPGVRLALAATFALFLSRVFCEPGAVLRTYSRAAPQHFDEEAAAAVKRALSVANRRSLALVMGVAVIPTAATLLETPVSFTMATFFSLALVVAVALDLYGEARARIGAVLVTARPLHRVYAVQPVLATLAEAGITGFARSRTYRALFHFFAPYAPIEILVPEERTQEAEAICAGIVVDT